jgi:hypothetical protein
LKAPDKKGSQVKKRKSQQTNNVGLPDNSFTGHPGQPV